MDEKTRQATRLWTLNQPIVSAFITSVVRDFRDRDDILQDTAIAVIESINHYDQSRPFLPWAIGIARNQVGLYLRRRKRDRHVFDESAMASLAAAFYEVPIESSHRLDFLRDCLKTLKDRARTICDLRYSRDLKPAEIAKQLGMSANSVAKALQRVREQLNDCINKRTLESVSQ